MPSVSQAVPPWPAVVPAAGLSRRMGTPKQLMPLGDGTMLTQVIDRLLDSGCGPVVVVLGHEARRIAASLQDRPVVIARNHRYQVGDMLGSVQCGLAHLLDARAAPGPWPGCLLALGDQPGVAASTVQSVLREARGHPASVVFPSFRQRRGHPFVIPRHLWTPILELPPDATLRHVMRQPDLDVRYVTVDSDDILQDVDTPEQYRKIRDDGFTRQE